MKVKVKMSLNTLKKVHKCLACDRSFTRRSYLIRHIRNHFQKIEINNRQPDLSTRYYLRRKRRKLNDEKTKEVPLYYIIVPFIPGNYSYPSYDNIYKQPFDFFTNQENRKTEAKKKMDKLTKKKKMKVSISTKKIEKLTTKKKIRNNVKTKRKSHKCNFCVATFSDNYNLQRHLRVHTGEKPFKCNTCGYMCKQKTHLILHERTHTGEKPHVCDFCSKAFKTKGSLIDHKRTHTNEKPFACNECDKKYATSSNLAAHKKSHLKIKVSYCCDICNSTCARKDNFTRHMNLHLKHNEC